MTFIDTRTVLGLSIWVLGFALMTAGWLVDALFEDWGRIPSRVLYKAGALIVAFPVVVLLWKLSRLLYTRRVDIVLCLNDVFRLFGEMLRVL